jgi:hypothetical protein
VPDSDPRLALRLPDWQSKLLIPGIPH